MNLHPPPLKPAVYRQLLQLFASTHPDEFESQNQFLAHRWTVHHHLSKERLNLLRPFVPLLADQYVLEVGASSGLITRFLGQRARRVVALEPDAYLMQLARLRTRDLSNVDLQQASWMKFVPERLFDVVVVPDGLPEQWEGLLERAYSWLAPHGCLLLATPNPWGLSYRGQDIPNHPGRSASYLQLRQLARKQGFVEAQIHLPFPNHRLPGNLITPEGLSEPRFNVGELVMMQGHRGRQHSPATQQVAAYQWLKAFDQGAGPEVANSFLLVAYRQPPLPPPEDEVLAYHYQGWGPEVTRFVRDSLGGLWVEKILPDTAPVRHRYLQGQLLMARLAIQLENTRHPEVVLAQFITTYLGILKQLSGRPQALVSLNQPVHSGLVDAHPGNIVIDSSGEPHGIDVVSSRDTPMLGVVLLRGLIVTASDLPFPSRWPRWVGLEEYLARALIRAGLFKNRAAFGAYLRHNNLLIPRVRMQLIPADAALPLVFRPLARVLWKMHDQAIALLGAWPGLKKILWRLRNKG